MAPVATTTRVNKAEPRNRVDRFEQRARPLPATTRSRTGTTTPRASSSNGTAASADLSVEVNGLKFMNPFVCGSGPPGTNYAVMKKAFEEGG